MRTEPKAGEQSVPPRIVDKLQSQKAPDGSQIEFACRVEGVPRPQITWFRQTAIIKPSQDFHIYYDDSNRATLVIQEVFPEDAGTFTCVAKNCVGYASSSAELVVDHPLSEHGSLEKHDRRSLSRESSLADIVEGIPPTFAQRPQVNCLIASYKWRSYYNFNELQQVIQTIFRSFPLQLTRDKNVEIRYVLSFQT